MEDLKAAIREACPAAVWSKGVELVRRLVVTGVSADEEEIVCRVKAPKRTVPFTVLLYPIDAEWDCDCQTRAPCCEHVAAAVIAVSKARAEGAGLPQGRSTDARLVYRFSRFQGELAMRRVLVKSDGSESTLATSLASAVARQTEGLEISPTQSDLNIDRALGQRTAGPIPRDLLPSVIKLLAAARNVELEGKLVHVSTELLRPQATVSDERRPNGTAAFRVSLARDPRLTEVVASGVGLAGDTIHLLAAIKVAGPKWEALPSERIYPAEEASALVMEVLPELKKKFALQINTRNLPEVTRDERPRMQIHVEQFGDSLNVMATLVYGEPALARIDGGRLVHLRGPIPLRDEPQEQRVIHRTRETLGLLPGSRVSLRGAEATKLANRLDRWGGEICGLKASKFIHHTELVPVLMPRGDGLSLTFAANADEPAGEESGPLTASADAVMRAFDEGDHLVPLNEGGWAELPVDWLAKHADVVADLLAARETDANGQEQLRGFGLPALAQLCHALNYPAPPALEALQELATAFDQIIDVELPADLTADLRHYQRAGVNWLCFLRDAGMGATLADDMGLGKTLQALCALRGRSLVVCPTSVIHNWAAELKKFRPGLKYNVYHGGQRKLDDAADVTLTSYAILRLDQAQLSRRSWDCLVLDEAQTIKNPESLVAQAAFAMPAKFRLTLSGTPVENRLDELWSQFHFTNPGLLGGRSAFQQRFGDPIRDGDAQAASRLRKKIKPFLLRRDKRTVAPELPPRTDIVLHCQLDEKQRELYDAILTATKRDVVEKLRAGGSVMQALEALLRLRQAACHPSLIPGSQTAKSAKLQRLVAALVEAQADGHKALVFSQWTSFLDLIEPALLERDITFSRLDGSTRDRQAVVDEFQSPNGPQVMLLSLKAGGTGLNLTAADHVFLMDLWWNPAVEQQAADRAHRIGQENPVFVHRLVSKDTVEERILVLQEQKRALADAVLSEGAGGGGLTRDDLLALLE